MKRIKFILILLMFIPCFIFAESYDKAHSIIENYMNTVTYKNTYRLFLYDNKSDFIDYNEYLITNKKGNSYLFDGTKFWTKTKKDNKYYVVSFNEELVEKENTTISAKDSEYVLPNTYVSGSGTIDNPWIFKKGYKVSISSNEFGKISLSGENKDLTNKLNLNMINTSEKLIYVYPNTGYEYISNTCGAVYTGNYLTLSNVNMNKICEVVFGIKSYKITLDNTNNDINKSNPEVIYSVENIGYFSNESATTLINKITIPKRTGYTFKGYSKDGTNTTKFIDTNGNVIQSNNNLFNEDSLAKIIEEPITYEVKYDKNDSLATGTMSNSVHTYDKSETLSPNSFTKTGYYLAGWSLSSNGAINYNDKSKVKNLGETQGQIVTLYAKWSGNTYTVTFDSNYSGGVKSSKTQTYDSNYSFPSNPSRTGYTFNGWYTSSSGGTKVSTSTKVSTASDHTLYAHWDVKYFTLDVNGMIDSSKIGDINGTGTFSISINGATAQTGLYDYYVSLAYGTTYNITNITPLTGHTYTGQSSYSGTIGEYNAEVVLPFEHIKYTLTFDAQGGSTPSSIVLNHGSQYGTLPNTTRKNFAFNGWYTSKSGGTKVSSTTTISSNTTIYAQWTKMCTYRTGHVNDGGTNAEGLKTIFQKNFEYIMGTPTTWDDKYGYTMYLSWAPGTVLMSDENNYLFTQEQMNRIIKVFNGTNHNTSKKPYIGWLYYVCGDETGITKKW